MKVDIVVSFQPVFDRDKGYVIKGVAPRKLATFPYDDYVCACEQMSAIILGYADPVQL